VGGDSEASLADRIIRGVQHIRERDSVLAKVADRVGPFSLQLEPDVFTSMVRSILAQQISTAAARSIYKRLLTTLADGENLLQALGQSSVDQLRSCGISPQKARYLSDLAEKVNSGVVRLNDLHVMSNEEVILELTRVKGIGVWTVQMLLIFSLGRLDVFPGADLGIRTAIKKLYRKPTLPTPTQLRKFERLWQPYATIASWYCWRSLEFKD
jgi:DNA-3-methyladenine glycosylase II